MLKLILNKFLPLGVTKLALPVFVKSLDRRLLVTSLLVLMLDTKVALVDAALHALYAQIASLALVEDLAALAPLHLYL